MFHNHGKGKTTVLNVHGKFIVRTLYSDGVERCEEWITTTSSKSKSTSTRTSSSNNNRGGQLVCRKWKETNKSLTNNGEEWTYEIHCEKLQRNPPPPPPPVELLLRSANENPTFYCVAVTSFPSASDPHYDLRRHPRLQAQHHTAVITANA